ncbi:MAG: YciI family protein [Candidatus Manganitrophus sp. SB1]|nr:YciI family protein [Candidatus Manganitrophus morganii]
MKFVMIGLDGPDGAELRKQLRPSHLERLEKLTAEKKLILAGPFGDKSGSLIVFEAGSLEEAVAWGEADPYVSGGVFSRYEIKPFTQVFPKE